MESMIANVAAVSVERCSHVPAAAAAVAVVDSEAAVDRPSVAEDLSSSSAVDGADRAAAAGKADIASAAATLHCCQRRLDSDAAVTLAR